MITGKTETDTVKKNLFYWYKLSKTLQIAQILPGKVIFDKWDYVSHSDPGSGRWDSLRMGRPVPTSHVLPVYTVRPFNLIKVPILWPGDGWTLRYQKCVVSGLKKRMKRNSPVLFLFAYVCWIVVHSTSLHCALRTHSPVPLSESPWNPVLLLYGRVLWTCDRHERGWLGLYSYVGTTPQTKWLVLSSRRDLSSNEVSRSRTYTQS